MGMYFVKDWFCKPSKKTYQGIWVPKTWNGYSSIYGNAIWTDGENIYYSNSSTQKLLNKSTSTWNTKTWNELTSLNGNNIWTIGDHIYYSSGTTQYELT